MDTGRLGAVRRQENSRRKFVILLNDALKTNYDVVDECLSREKFETGLKYDKSFVSIRRAIARQRVFQQCLKMKRQSKNGNDRKFGVYGGKPLYSYSRNIERFISDMHPKKRRARQTEHALKEGLDKGKILDPKTIPAKIQNYFEINWKAEKEEIKVKPKPPKVEERTDIFKNTKDQLPPIGGLLNSYNIYKRANEYTVLQRTTYDIGDSEPLNDNALLEKTITKSSNAMTDRPAGKESNTPRSREPSRGLLILPPIKPSKLIAQR